MLWENGSVNPVRNFSKTKYNSISTLLFNAKFKKYFHVFLMGQALGSPQDGCHRDVYTIFYMLYNLDKQTDGFRGIFR